MAGSAEGAAKARAARAAKRDAMARLEQEAEQSARNAVVTLDDLQQRSIATGGEPGAVPSQSLTSALVDAAGPEAVRKVIMTMRQAKSEALKFAAACKLLDLGQQQRDAKRKPGDGEGMLQRVTEALQLRRRREEAVTVDVLPQSAQAPDK